MSGRALPAPFLWASLPPAPSVSMLWGHGGCKVEHAGADLEMGPGQAMWIDGGHPHRGSGMAGSDFVTVFVPAWDDGSSVTGAAVFEPSHAWRGLLLSVAASILEGAPDSEAIAALARGRDQLHPDLTHRAAPAGLRRARRLLDARFEEDLGLRELARVAGLSPGHVCRDFGARWGISPVQYRKQLRLLAATRRILQGESITDAAIHAGFSDAAHLSRTFRRQYGIAPSRWRAQVGARLFAGQGRGTALEPLRTVVACTRSSRPPFASASPSTRG